MPMTNQRYQRIKAQMKLWNTGNLEDCAHLDTPVVVEMLLEMRGVLNELITAQEEGSPSLGERIRGFFHGE
jgi:hypothetical protein